MKILSIDVGMKNLAYCLFNIHDNLEYNIEKWDVIDLCKEKIHMCGEKKKNENPVKKRQNFLKMINIIVKFVLEIKNTRYLFQNIKKKIKKLKFTL